MTDKSQEKTGPETFLRIDEDDHGIMGSDGLDVERFP